jgi:hypothetical protein
LNFIIFVFQVLVSREDYARLCEGIANINVSIVDGRLVLREAEERVEEPEPKRKKAE